GQRSGEEKLSLFVERLSDYKATVKQVDQQMLSEAIAKNCRGEEIDTLAVPDGFPVEWLPETIMSLIDQAGSPLSRQQLNNADGVISTCELAIAQTGTIVLTAGSGQGRRALTLLPDYH